MFHISGMCWIREECAYVWETCASSHAPCPYHQRRLLAVWNQMTGLLLLQTVITWAWGLTPDPSTQLPLAALGHACQRVPRPRLRPTIPREQAGGLRVSPTCVWAGIISALRG